MPTYRWARRGDLNAFFGLMIDNVAVMGILLASVTDDTVQQLVVGPRLPEQVRQTRGERLKSQHECHG